MCMEVFEKGFVVCVGKIVLAYFCQSKLTYCILENLHIANFLLIS